MSRDVRIYLTDIAERCDRITRYVAKMDEATWAGDDLTQDAVARNLEIIGEAVKRLPMKSKLAGTIRGSFFVIKGEY